jgi:hypothetical protein
MLAIICRLANHTDSCIRRAHRSQLHPYHRQRMKLSSQAGGFSARSVAVNMSSLHASSSLINIILYYQPQ